MAIARSLQTGNVQSSSIAELWQYDTDSKSLLFDIGNVRNLTDVLRTGSALIDSGKVRPTPLPGKYNTKVARYAEMCNVVFESGMKRRKVAKKLGMKVDANFETPNMMLMYDVQSETTMKERPKKAVICFRGTNITDLADLQTDFAIWRGTEAESGAFANALLATRMAISKYGKNVTVTGFSLGGRIGLYVATKLDLTAHLFNPGISFRPLLSKIIRYMKGLSTEKIKQSLASLGETLLVERHRKKRTKINIYIVRGDVISNYLLLSEDQGHNIYLFKMQSGSDRNPHLLGNFLLHELI